MTAEARWAPHAVDANLFCKTGLLLRKIVTHSFALLGYAIVLMIPKLSDSKMF